MGYNPNRVIPHRFTRASRRYLRMSIAPPIPSSTETTDTNCKRPLHHSLCWGAVLAGTLVALSIHWLLLTLGAGAGLTFFKPVAEVNPAAHLSAGRLVAWSLFAIIALSLGGWVAGRLSGCLRSGLLHGVLVWSLTVVLTLPGLALGTALAAHRAMKHQAETLRSSRQTLAVAEDDFAKAATKRNQDQLDSFVVEAIQSITTNSEPKAATRAQREVGFALTKLFAPENTAAFPANRLDAINTLAVYTQMSAADATTTMDAWTMSHNNLQAELDRVKAELNNHRIAVEQNAQAATDEIAVQRTADLSRTAKGSFFALLIGLLSASLAGRCGAGCASRNANCQSTAATSA